MTERSFEKEVRQLRIGAGQEFIGEGVLGVTKALLEAGVAYVGGYQGAPITHLMDVFADANEILEDLGVVFQSSASEATAAAMLAASVNYPLRGAVTWKSTVGTNVASDALSNIASAGVIGGALIICGEDYGEGASIMQERTHAFAMKSQMWLLDPRPNLKIIVRMVDKGFELSEASNTPVILQLRIRACHLHGRFPARDNQRPRFSAKDALDNPVADPGRIILPPYTYAQERAKVDQRWPAAVAFIKQHALNETFDGECTNVGIVLQGGLYNTTNRALELLGCSDPFGKTRVPLYVLNVTYPLIDDELLAFCQDKEAILLIEEGQPDYLEQAINTLLRRRDVQTRISGKGLLPMAGEYTGAVVKDGIEKFLERWAPQALQARPAPMSHGNQGLERAVRTMQQAVPPRPPTLCTGCPERPFFTALKLLGRETGPLQVSADIGCHSFATLPPFSIGNTITGYGLGPASASALNIPHARRAISIVGDGGFWHGGIASGVVNAVQNEHDGIIVLVDNGYSSATGGQWILSSRADRRNRRYRVSLPGTLKGLGVGWLRKVRTYDIQQSLNTLREAMRTKARGPKVIIAEGECQLNRQRRIKPIIKRTLKQGKRYVRERFGVDDDTCTGDHSCIRLSGCPSLTIKDNPDPLRKDPIAYVLNTCVGCGVCGEVAHAAVLCPSFYRGEIVFNPNRWERIITAARNFVIGSLQTHRARALAKYAF
jgi:indolepyruvate ferredoxin oxidoreductase alpha subunit